ncbi:MAG: YtxH domain-containing protein [Endomicrobiales bacterium]
MAERNSGEVMLAFILGGIVGAAIGMLYAPYAGKETRQKLKDMGEDLTDRFEDLGEQVKTKTKQMVNEGKDKILSQKERLEEAFDAGRKAFEKKQQQQPM